MSRIKLSRMTILFFFFFILSCQGSEVGKSPEKLTVVTTLFPLYDFARHVAGSRADVSLLLPPGAEPHGFEPRPADLMRLNASHLFIYTSPDMEPWAADLLKGLRSSKLLVVNASLGIAATGGRGEMESRHDPRDHADHQHKSAVDPHLWLDFAKAMKMVDNIRDGLVQKDPEGRELYEKNAAAFNEQLKDLDRRYRTALQGCRIRSLITGGHFAFHYLASRYGLEYYSVYGFSPDAEPSPGSLARISEALKQKSSRHLFYEELIDPRVARTIASETGASLIRLHGAHNLTKEEFDRGETFIGIMNDNLKQLKKGLDCP